MKFERRARALAWFVRGLMLLTALAGICGLFGSGPLAWARAEDPGATLRLEYERFVRCHCYTDLVVHVASRGARDGLVRLSFDEAWLEGAWLDEVRPEPVRVETARGRRVYVFAVADGAGLTARFKARLDRMGSRPGVLSVEGGPSVTFRHIAFP